MEKQNPIKLKVVKEDGYYAYHLPIITQLGILEDALQECNIDIDLVFEFENKIGLCGGGIFYDDFYLYSLMLRYLFPNNKTMMISDSLLKLKKSLDTEMYNLDTFEIYWSNRIEYKYDSKGDSTIREFGFLGIFEFFKKVNYFTYRQNKDNPDTKNWKHEGVYLTNRELRIFYKTYISDVTSWCFLSGKDLKNTQKKLMDSTKRPTVKEIVDEVETMVTLQLGEDEGYEGYVLVYSKTDISEKIKNMEKMIVDFGTRYEKFLPKIEKMVESSSNEEIFLMVKKFLDDFDVEYQIGTI